MAQRQFLIIGETLQITIKKILLKIKVEIEFKLILNRFCSIMWLSHRKRWLHVTFCQTICSFWAFGLTLTVCCIHTTILVITVTAFFNPWDQLIEKLFGCVGHSTGNDFSLSVHVFNIRLINKTSLYFRHLPHQKERQVQLFTRRTPNYALYLHIIVLFFLPMERMWLTISVFLQIWAW